MVFIANIIDAIAGIIGGILNLYMYVIIASAILSFVNPDPYNPIVRFIRGITEPAFNFVRRYMPFLVVGGIDLSPLVIIVGIAFLQGAVVRNLHYLARMMM